MRLEDLGTDTLLKMHEDLIVKAIATGMVPKKVQVTRGGKTFEQTVYVKPDEASQGVDTARAVEIRDRVTANQDYAKNIQSLTPQEQLILADHMILTEGRKGVYFSNVTPEVSVKTAERLEKIFDPSNSEMVEAAEDMMRYGASPKAREIGHRLYKSLPDPRIDPDSFYLTGNIEEDVNKVVSGYELSSGDDHALWLKCVVSKIFNKEDRPEFLAGLYRFGDPDKRYFDVASKLYNDTQEYYYSRGIDKIKLYRGLRRYKDEKLTLHDSSVLTSWSTERDRAYFHGKGGDTKDSQVVSKIISAEIPVSDILYSYETVPHLPGTPGEIVREDKEFVVIRRSGSDLFKDTLIENAILTGTVPKKVQVTRGGKTFTQTVYVKPGDIPTTEEAKPLDIKPEEREPMEVRLPGPKPIDDDTFLGRVRKVRGTVTEGDYDYRGYDNTLYIENTKLRSNARVEFDPQGKIALVDNLSVGWEVKENKRGHILDLIKDISTKVPEDYELDIRLNYGLERGVLEGLVNEGIAVRQYSKEKGAFYRLHRDFKPRGVSEVTMLDKIETSYESLRSDTVHFNVNGKDIFIGHGTSWYRVDNDEPEVDQKLVILIGPKEWLGKKFYDILEVKESVIAQYRNTLHFSGGDFAKAEYTKNRRIVDNMIYRFKNAMGPEPKYLINMAQGYFNKAKVDDYEGKDIIKQYDESRKEYERALGKPSGDYFSEESMYNDMFYQMGTNEYEGSKITQEAVNQFYSGVKDTQEKLKELIPEGKVILYRGVQGNYAKNIKDALKKDTNVEVPMYEVNSWTTSKPIANTFATGSAYGKGRHSGVILKASFPIKDILFAHSTSVELAPEKTALFGGTAEDEFVVSNMKGKMIFDKTNIEEAD